ncbi:hypothetical protein Sme01_54180 [Sphaerisporangium melleum]|uniref:Uncharacterized protein n=1 Tax=Sphaerisporangium melleum TaxID=321316 RepID=A0A917R6K3_9ACTN|nr:hypothetical protein [Sphaerisporangium melleum]GGK91811.1 hypothetical protein GCM10007964_38040 [Sphaerisporangium melleum]GII72942.1 hypothetical protein Sme01_54180 [Sphaerisporangium melleum]
MNDSRSGPTNLATDSAYVAVQAEAIHGPVNVYQVTAAPSPEETFKAGLNSLRAGMAPEARKYIRDAVVLCNYVNGQSCFYLLLALLSGRTLQQVPPKEIAVLRSVRGAVKNDDEWADAIKLVDHLLTSRSTEGGAADVEQELQKLTDGQRNDVLQHMEMFLDSSAEDTLWARAFDAARSDRYAKDRLRRAWKFFQPEPIGARVRPADPVLIRPGIWTGAAATTALALVTVGFIGATAWQHNGTATVPALLALAAGCYASVRSGVEWRCRKQRRQAKDREYLRRSVTTRGDGFASKIDRQFDHYFALYTPRDADRARWLSETAGVRRALRDEVVTIYRESTVNAKRVAWLTRYLVADVARRWQAGKLWDYRKELRVPLLVKAMCVLGAIAAATAGAFLIWSGAHVRPLIVPLSAFVALASVWLAARIWLPIATEYKRHSADKAEKESLLAGRQAAFDRWKRKLADRPDDLEMARWLECDRKALMEEAMGFYRLKRQDVLAHAFIEAPATPSYDRARIENGPWRYSKYKILLFLLTKDGVRQLTVHLDFQKAIFRSRARTNYRYDAFTSVQVAETDNGENVFELTLTNGDPIKVKVTDPPTDVTQKEDKDPQGASQVTLSTAGLGNALHVLEGVAAEGKEWMALERQREKVPLAEMSKAVNAIFV